MGGAQTTILVDDSFLKNDLDEMNDIIPLIKTEPKDETENLNDSGIVLEKAEKSVVRKIGSVLIRPVHVCPGSSDCPRSRKETSMSILPKTVSKHIRVKISFKKSFK